MPISRPSESPPPVVRPLSGGMDDLQSAVEMAREWGEAPFDEARALSFLHSSGRGFVAFRGGRAAGLLLRFRGGLWSDGGAPCAFAPLVWSRGRDGRGAAVSSREREQTALALVRAFLEWARDSGAVSARAVFRNGMTPDSAALSELGLRRDFRLALRKSPLPGDPVSGRMRWFSTDRREAQGEEMDLPFEEMFPELFSDSRESPPPVRRLTKGDEKAALEVVRDSRLARGLPFSEEGFRSLFRSALSRRDSCALATLGEDAGEERALCGIVIGFSRPHPFADGRIALAEVLECRAHGAKRARRALWGLWRGFMLWAGGGLCRAMLSSPPLDKFGDDFARRHRLSPFGVCWSAEWEAENGENAG